MYTVEISPHAQRQLDSLPEDLRTRITQRALALGENPRPPGVKKLRGKPDRYRIRVGAYRVKYAIQDDQRIVTVVEVVHRRDAY